MQHVSDRASVEHPEYYSPRVRACQKIPVSALLDYVRDFNEGKLVHNEEWKSAPDLWPATRYFEFGGVDKAYSKVSPCPISFCSTSETRSRAYRERKLFPFGSDCPSPAINSAPDQFVSLGGVRPRSTLADGIALSKKFNRNMSVWRGLA